MVEDHLQGPVGDEAVDVDHLLQRGNQLVVRGLRSLRHAQQRAEILVRVRGLGLPAGEPLFDKVGEDSLVEGAGAVAEYQVEEALFEGLDADVEPQEFAVDGYLCHVAARRGVTRSASRSRALIVIFPA